MTRFEQIKSFTLEEMTEWLSDTMAGCNTCSRDSDKSCHDVTDCRIHIKEWLESEADI